MSQSKEESSTIPVSLEAVGESIMAVCGEAFDELRHLRIEAAVLRGENTALRQKLADAQNQ